MFSSNMLKTKAKTVGVNNPSSDKTELIRQIQTAEGYTPCYKTKKECAIMNCCWRGDCLKE
jgi:hypothetical protein